MKFKIVLGIVLLGILASSGCNPGKEAESISSNRFTGKAVEVNNPSNTQVLTIKIDNEGSPVKGSWEFGTGSNMVKGLISGTALGLIYSLRLSPDPSGTNYNVECTWDEKKLIGTMKGFPNGKAIEYYIELIAK